MSGSAAKLAVDTDRLMARKLRRIMAGEAIRTLDLFAGCGGIALGFHAAGFHTLGSVEIDALASESFAHNFGKTAGAPLDALAKPKDITLLDPVDVFGALGHDKPVEDTIDVLVGGPPCQAFARVGRAKLREVDVHPQAFKQDPRANLYLRYLAYIRETRPLAILMENVPDVLNHGGHNVAEEVCEVLEGEGYQCQYTLLNSAFYGVPQTRERMFLVAIHRVCKGAFAFPKPTHSCKLPVGYEGTRSVALKTLRSLLDAEGGQEVIPLGEGAQHFFVRPPKPPSIARPAITVKDALSDLPFLNAQRLINSGELRRGAKRFDQAKLYRSEAQTGYQRLMRSWPGFEAWREGVFDHVIRYLPRDGRLFERMNPGDQYPQLKTLAEALFEKEDLPRLRREGVEMPKPGTKAWAAFKARYVPPYDDSKFPNKWRKLEADRPSRTLLAHLGKDSYSHIHYDSRQGRTISVREGARLQSFPDGFVFRGTINPAFRQIGNAVPPLMAYALAREIRVALGQPCRSDLRTGLII